MNRCDEKYFSSCHASPESKFRSQIFNGCVAKYVPEDANHGLMYSSFYSPKLLAFSFSYLARGRFGSFWVVLGSFFRPLGIVQNLVGIQNSLQVSVSLCDSLLGQFEKVIRDAGDFPFYPTAPTRANKCLTRFTHVY